MRADVFGGRDGQSIDVFTMEFVSNSRSVALNSGLAVSFISPTHKEMIHVFGTQL